MFNEGIGMCTFWSSSVITSYPHLLVQFTFYTPTLACTCPFLNHTLKSSLLFYTAEAFSRPVHWASNWPVTTHSFPSLSIFVNSESAVFTVFISFILFSRWQIHQRTVALPTTFTHLSYNGIHCFFADVHNKWFSTDLIKQTIDVWLR